MNPNLYRVALVGAAGLKGRELNDVLNERNFPAVEIKLLDDDDSLGQLEAVGEEATFIQAIGKDQFENVDFTFFACEADFTRRHWKMAKNAGSSVIDLSYALEEESRVSIRAPWVERELGIPQSADLEFTTAVTAHPAATVLAMLLLRAQKAAKLERIVATVFEPVSERGKRGMDELHEQTINLLSFQAVPKNVFDIQVAFNLLARFGGRAGMSLESVEQRILRHLAHISRGRLPVPSLMLVQAPIFHAHVFSIYIELDRPMPVTELSQRLSGEHVVITPADEEPPNNINVAGEEDILLAVRADLNRQDAFWLWASADNLKLAALTAMDCAAALALTRSKGSVQ